MVQVRRMTMRSIRTCEVCCQDRTDNIDNALVIADHVDARDHVQETPVALVWVYVGTTMCGVVTCTRKPCIDATIACCDRFVDTNNIIPLECWLDLSGGISWWRGSKHWIHDGHFDRHDRYPGRYTTMADAACPIVFSNPSDRPITTNMQKDHADYTIKLRDIFKATPRLRRMAILELQRPPGRRWGRDALQREVDASAPPNLLQGTVVAYLGVAVGFDMYSVQDDSQPFVPANLVGLGYNNVAIVGRIKDGTAINQARLLYTC